MNNKTILKSKKLIKRKSRNYNSCSSFPNKIILINLAKDAQNNHAELINVL